MPTKRKRRERFRKPDIDPVHWAMLTDSEIPKDANPFAEFTFKGRELWERHRQAILPEWIETKPGTRPSHWWLYDAPRMNDPGKLAGHYCLREMCEPRKLLRGIGRPAWEKYNITPRLHLGIPYYWTEGDTERLEFESQFAYLSRFRLLEPGEGESQQEPQFTPQPYPR